MPDCLFFCAASAYLTSENLNADISNHDSVEKSDEFFELTDAKTQKIRCAICFRSPLNTKWGTIIEVLRGIKP